MTTPKSKDFLEKLFSPDSSFIEEKLHKGQKEMLQEMIDKGISVYYLDEKERKICENKRGKFYQISQKTITKNNPHDEDKFYYEKEYKQF